MASMKTEKIASRLPQPRSVGVSKLQSLAQRKRRSMSESNLTQMCAKSTSNSTWRIPTNANQRTGRPISVRSGAAEKRQAEEAVSNDNAAKRMRPAIQSNVTRQISRSGISSKQNLPLKDKPGSKSNSNPVIADKQDKPVPKSKVAPWDTKGQLAIAREKNKQLELEKENYKEFLVQKQALQQQFDAQAQELLKLQSELVEANKKNEEAGLAFERFQKERENFQQEKQSFQQELLNCQREREKFVSQLSEYEETVSKLTASLNQCLQKLTESNLKCEDLKNEIMQEKSRSNVLTDKVSQLEHQYQLHLDEIFELQQQRKVMHNQIMDLKGNIRVFCRVRPPMDTEDTQALCNIDCLNECTIEVKKNGGALPSSYTSVKPKKENFTFNRVFSPISTQAEIYSELSQLVQSALDGYNICIFAYGQTGSGKTYTMEGVSDNPELVGMIPRSVETIFKCIEEQQKLGWKYTVSASFIEIYNEDIRDLLDRNSPLPHEIKMIDNTSDKVAVSNLRVEPVATARDLMGFLRVAQKTRSVAETVCNDYSSRSHFIMQIKLVGVNDVRDLQCEGNLNLIDLAGSEKYNTQNNSDRRGETININKSLSTLNLVIQKLAEKADHIPFRDSKLTYLLMSSLKGNSKTLMLVNISPMEDCYTETINSLRFADRVARVKIDSKRQFKPK